MDLIIARLDPETFLELYFRSIHSVYKAFCWVWFIGPIYRPEDWNDAGVIQYNNNCYNYACNKRTDTFAQPGRASGNMYQSLQCNEVKEGAISDGLKAAETCGPCCHKVALFVWPGVDYHWYRQDHGGMWSHKPGQTRATNLDNDNNPIDDPRDANRGGYTDFCGFFCVCRDKVTIQ
ncbi:MAG: hypothetical protein ACFFBR_09960 [Promethearchaeota archaeon]